MFHCSTDVDTGLGVGFFSGKTNTDQDFQRYLDTLLEMDTVIYEDVIPVFVLVVQKGNPAPNAGWRKKIAEATAAFNNDPKFVLVTDSALVRGAATALNWLRPPPYEMCITSTFAAAVDWARKFRADAAVLKGIFTSVQQKAGTEF